MNCSINSPEKSNNTNIAETSVLQTRINQVEREKSKLESELEHARKLAKTKTKTNQLAKTDGIQGFQSGNQKRKRETNAWQQRSIARSTLEID